MDRQQPPIVPETMLAARLHALGTPMSLDQIPVPEPRATDVLVKVDVCGVVPNMRRVIGNFFGTKTTDHKLFPPLPAIFGLDPVGTVAKLGAHVSALRPGERVYVNPARGCGSCRVCRAGHLLDCPDFGLQGYFGRSKILMSAYPYGGFSQFITAPASSLVRIPDGVNVNEAARLGYLGTAYAAMKKIGVGPGTSLLINGISGTLGVCAAMLALAMGATTILGVARNMELMERVRHLGPDRIRVFSADGASAASGGEDALIAWASRETGNEGVDAVLDCLPPGAPSSTLKRSIRCLRRGGRAANVGAVTEPLELDTFWMMTNRISLTGSVWFTPAEGEEILSLAACKHLDLSPLLHKVFPLAKINEALHSMDDNADGGFTNYVIDPKAYQ